MMKRLAELVRRGWGRPPHVILRWLGRQVRSELDQRLARRRSRRMTPSRLLAAVKGESLDSLWARLAESPFAPYTEPIPAVDYEKICPGDGARIIEAAEKTVERRVDLLGSGDVALGRPIQWHKDFKSGHGWPMALFRRLDVLDLGRDSDVKVPWELSRLQWLIPAGQAYLLTGEERYAGAARQVIEEWAEANPLARGVNWACTMDVALRGITLVWLFHVFNRSAQWWDGDFRDDFLKLLYLHGDFTSRHLEWTDVNGNHLLAGAAGLVVMGLFFGTGSGPRSWQRRGWQILNDELPRQVFADGVDFEASTAYHRLVLELFLLPALHRLKQGLDVPGAYASRLRRMAAFTAAYGRADGTSPLWGDADNGRVLPFGPQAWGDHRYLVGQVGLAFGDDAQAATAAGPEVFWMMGPDAAAKAAESAPEAPNVGSRAFPDGGVYIMRSDGGKTGPDHVFIDCGPVGLGGRGGHGHNDCLSFEAVLGGTALITDCGSYVYTADALWRNDFRSTAFHNTPMVDAQEQNRFVDPDYLWTLRDDATPEVRLWQTSDDADWFVGAHGGYRRLDQPLTTVRAIMLEKAGHRLLVVDDFEGGGSHGIRIPYHFHPGVEPEPAGPGLWKLRAGDRDFLLASDGEGWSSALGDGWVSPSYGVKHPARVLNFMLDGPPRPLAVALMPADGAPDDPLAWIKDAKARLPKPERG